MRIEEKGCFFLKETVAVTLKSLEIVSEFLMKLLSVITSVTTFLSETEIELVPTGRASVMKYCGLKFSSGIEFLNRPERWGEK